MKKSLLIVAVLMLAMSSISFGQSPTIRGTMDIKYDTRVQLDDSGKPQTGVVDTYKIDLSAADTTVFRGTIRHTPGIFGDYTGMMKQQSVLLYAIDLIVRNPADLSQEKVVGRMVGGVPIDGKGIYQYGQGTLRVAVDAAGKASGFESSFRGNAIGLPLKGLSTMEKLTKQARTLTKSVQGRTIKLVVTDYDKLGYQGLVLAAGPTKNYPEVTMNGEMLYDTERLAWYFTGLTMTYSVDGKSITDKISGNIKWLESPGRKTTGEGKYIFDIRLNESDKPAVTGEAAVFAEIDNEAAFFAVDNTIAGLTGEVKYKDSFSGDSVVASAVTYDLVGNQLSKTQVVNLMKWLGLVSVIPFNAE
jgi:hypothetical protein